MTSTEQQSAFVPIFQKLTAVRLAVIAYENEDAALERALSELSAGAIATFSGGKGRNDRNAFCIACIIDGNAWLAFRGSDDRTDWKRNFHFCARQGVHRGFLGEWLKLRTQVRAWLDQHHADLQWINLTGHSLGGAIAMIGARELFDLYPDQFGQIVTFGAPPPFYASAAEDFASKNVEGRLNGEALGYRTLRVVNQNDIFSWLPHIVGLRHVGELEKVGGPTLLGRLGAITGEMYVRMNGQETFRDAGIRIARIYILRWASAILRPFWVPIYLAVCCVAIILGIHRIFESGMSHLKHNYLVAIEPKPIRPAWQSVFYEASKVGRR